MLDSLTRLSDTRLQLSLSKNSLRALQSQNTALFAEKLKAQNAANEMAVRLFDANDAYQILHRRFRRTQVERWAWRVAAALTTYLIITH